MAHIYGPVQRSVEYGGAKRFAYLEVVIEKGGQRVIFDWLALVQHLVESAKVAKYQWKTRLLPSWA